MADSSSIGCNVLLEGVTEVICPTCNGSGNGGAVHVNTGFNKATGMCNGYWKQESKCFRCEGIGSVSNEMGKWIDEGREMRKARIERGELLHDAAKRMGIESSELSAIEQGRRPSSGNF